MSKILISGSSGFIGQNFLRIVENIPSLEIHSIVSKPIKENIIKAKYCHHLPNKNDDIDRLILEINPEIFINFAWKGIPDYTLDNSLYSVNNTIKLTQACLKSGTKKIISTGSCWEYLNPKGNVHEEWELDNSNFFKASKNFCNNTLNILCKEYDANLIWLRLFYVFGDYQHKNSLLPFLINEARLGREPIAKNPYASLDFINASDVSSVILKLIDLNDFSGNLNVGSGRSYLVGDIVNEVRSVFGYKKIIFNVDAENQVNFYSDQTKFDSLIEFNPSNIYDYIQKYNK